MQQIQPMHVAYRFYEHICKSTVHTRLQAQTKIHEINLAVLVSM